MKKSYTIDDFQKMPLVDYQVLKYQLDSKIDSLTSEEDKAILKEANEIINAPYEFQRNKFNFELGAEREAFIEEERQKNLLKKASDIKKRIKNELPEIELITAPNMITYEK